MEKLLREETLKRGGLMRNPLKIQLQNIPSEGWSFHFDQKSQELNQVLKDLIADNNYSIDIHIQPTGGSTYKIEGSIQTQLNLLCSRCAYEFKYKIHKTFSEKIIVQKKQERNEKKTRFNHYSERLKEEDFTVLSDSLFKLSDFIHEIITIEEPIRPLGFSECDQNDDCENLQKVKTSDVFHKKSTLEEKLKPLLERKSSSKN